MLRLFRWGGVRLSLSFCTLMLLCHFFFFFQAEDGIRDYKVTGVQTCALPIFEVRYSLCDAAAPRRGVHREDALWLRPERSSGSRTRDSGSSPRLMAWSTRSEERRVGKECRSRWSPYH